MYPSKYCVKDTAAAKSHAMKTLSPQELPCQSSNQSWQSVGTSSSLTCWRSWWTISFQQLHGLSPVCRWQLELTNVFGRMVIRSLQDMINPELMNVRLASLLVELLIGHKIKSIHSPDGPC